MSSRINRRDFLKLLPLLPLVRIQTPAHSLPEAANKPNVLILVFDTFSAPHASLYGYQRETTPHLSRFAAQSIVYHRHYAGGNFTPSGTASLLTGTYPWTHRALQNRSSVIKPFQDRSLFHLFPDEYYKIAFTHNALASIQLADFQPGMDVWVPRQALAEFDIELADDLFARDYSVALQSERMLLHRPLRTRGSLYLSFLERFQDSYKRRALNREYGQLFPRGIPNFLGYYFLLETVIDWLQEQLTSLPQPYLLYCHVYPPHEPYRPRHEFIKRFDDGWAPAEKPVHFDTQGFSAGQLALLRREYDDYVAYADAEFGRLLDFMQSAGVFDNTYVIFTSDHGQLFERGIHGHITAALYESIVHIPLLIARPGQSQRQDIDTVTSCVDLLPTLLQVTGQPIPDWCEGIVLPAFSEAQVEDDRTVFMVEAKQNGQWAPLTVATVALRKGAYKLIHNFGYGVGEDAYELYDLAHDPEEFVNLVHEEPAMAASLQDEMNQRLQQANEPYQTSG